MEKEDKKEVIKVKQEVVAVVPLRKQKFKCFVMMPFGNNNEYSQGHKESNFVYHQIIKKGIEKFEASSNCSVEVIQQVDKNIGGSITRNILLNIASSDICIVDITGRNPNVFLELGIRYSLRNKTTILLRQEDTQIPFDIAGYKCLVYDCFRPDPAISAIAEFLNAGLEEVKTDSLVFETFPGLQVAIPEVLESRGASLASENALSWEEWWRRVLSLADLLWQPFDSGRYVPQAVLGISNGGLIVADLLGREVFKGVPILSLWANRWLKNRTSVDESCYFFDNDYNIAILATLRKNFPKEQDRLVIQVVDDLVFTSTTIIQATTFIKRELGDNIDLLFTPLYCRDIDYLVWITHMLPCGYGEGKVFAISEEEYFGRLTSNRAFFPYKKATGIA